jgi:ornithine cyclodeaminase/alanine dehydrogenase-like protein (mu-crystallin family)
LSKDTLIYLSAEDVAAVMPSPAVLVELLESMFRHKAQGNTEMPPKLGIHPSDDGFLHAMPASIPKLSAAGLKWVAAYPKNAARGLPQVSGLMILNDPETGIANAILDASVITASRTAAASALAARYLARRDSETLGILGCGVQGRSHLEAFASEFSLRSVRAFDVHSSAATRFATEASDSHPFDVVTATSAREVVVNCDIVITAGPITNPPHAAIQPGWLQPGAFASSIDYGSYWHADALAEMDILCTDDIAQYASHQEHGYLQGLPAINLELARLVTGEHAGRLDAGQRTFACNLGIALEDVVVAKNVVDRARQLGLGQDLTR